MRRKRSRSQNSTAGLDAVGVLRPTEAGAEPLGERHPIGQAGERITTSSVARVSSTRDQSL